jgi:hypothetical protein
MRAGCLAIACGPPTLRALHAWPPQPLQGPHGGSFFAPGRQGARTRVQLGLRHRPRSRFGLQPLSGFYSDSAYEFDFGSDPEDPESEDNTTEHPLSGPASGLVITSTPAGRFVYWPDRKPTDLISGDSRYVAYLDSLPFQEGTPLARADSYTPTEVASSESSLDNPDRHVFMAAGDTPGHQGRLKTSTLRTSLQMSCLLMHLQTRPPPTGTLDVSVTGSAATVPASQRTPPDPQPCGSSRAGREQSTHYPRAVPHVDHGDRTPSSGNTRRRSHRQAR